MNAPSGVVILVHMKRGTLKQGVNTVHRTHREAAEQHELAAHAHRTAAEHNEKGGHDPEIWHLERALEFSDHAWRLAKEARSKSGKMETIDVDTL